MAGVKTDNTITCDTNALDLRGNVCAQVKIRDNLGYEVKSDNNTNICFVNEIGLKANFFPQKYPIIYSPS